MEYFVKFEIGYIVEANDEEEARAKATRTIEKLNGWGPMCMWISKDVEKWNGFTIPKKILNGVE